MKAVNVADAEISVQQTPFHSERDELKAHELLFSLALVDAVLQRLHRFRQPIILTHERLIYRPMKAALANEQAIASPIAESLFWPAALVIITLSLIWFEVVRHLQSEWSYNPQYSYGWSVPFLVLYMIWRRWPSRPDPLRPVCQRGATFLLAAGTFVLLAVRFVAEANPDWRFLSWIFALYRRRDNSHHLVFVRRKSMGPPFCLSYSVLSGRCSLAHWFGAGGHAKPDAGRYCYERFQS